MTTATISGNRPIVLFIRLFILFMRANDRDTHRCFSANAQSISARMRGSAGGNGRSLPVIHPSAIAACRGVTLRIASTAKLRSVSKGGEMRSRFIVASIVFVLAASLSAAPGPKPDVGDGRVAWFDITTTNLQQSKDFYAKLFGWEYTTLKGAENLAAEIVSGGQPIG